MNKYTLIAALFYNHFTAELLAIQVTVPYNQRSTMLFASVILRCDYSTSANLQEVLVTWRYKSFCLDPVLQYYTTVYQAALTLGQNPANDCPDRQRTIRTVIQKNGNKEPILGAEYRERKITILNKADLVITEVMWWDNGVYFCSIDVAGDTIGDSDQEVELIVYNWLTVLLIIIGGLLLIILLGVCCCQCCPQRCCCYVRCPCCPKVCCCPEKDVMQHRMLRNAQKAMAPWVFGQPFYPNNDSRTSSQAHPLLYSGSFSEFPSKNNIPMGPMAVPSPQPIPPMAFPHDVQSTMLESVHGSERGTNPMLDFLERQVRAMDVGASLVSPLAQYPGVPLHALHPQAAPPPVQPEQPIQPLSRTVSFTRGPPSMLSALEEMGVHGVERRVIRLPPIVSRAPSLSSRRAPRDARGGNRLSSHSSGSSNRLSGRRNDSRRDPDSPHGRGILRGYRERSRTRMRSKGELVAEQELGCARQDRSYFPSPRQASWSSEEENGHKGAVRSRDRAWTEKPPSYSSIEIQPGHRGRTNGRYSVGI